MKSWFALVVLLLALAPLAGADEHPPPAAVDDVRKIPGWGELTPHQRRALREEWQQAGPQRRREMERAMRRWWKGMSASQRREVRDRWHKLSPKRQQHLCKRFYRERGRAPRACFKRMR